MSEYKVPDRDIKILMGDVRGPEGWTTIDRDGGIIRMHLDQKTKFSMFDDNSVSYIYSSHMIEHMELESVQNIFNEAYRILKPGGVIRTCCPNASQFIQVYKMDPEAKSKCLLPHNLLCAEFVCYCDPPQYGHTFDKAQFDIMIAKTEEEFSEWVTSHYESGRAAGHMTAFTPDKVRALYVKAGFEYENTFDMEYRKSNIPEIAEIDLQLRKNISLYVEGIK